MPIVPLLYTAITLLGLNAALLLVTAMLLLIAALRSSFHQAPNGTDQRLPICNRCAPRRE
jgi:hypothetical protein